MFLRRLLSARSQFRTTACATAVAPRAIADSPLCPPRDSGTVPPVNKRKNKMDLGLKGRNAVVLGGTRGIGRAIAGTLAAERAGVAVCARNADQVASTVAELKAQGVQATGAPVDITDAAALKSWISGVAQELGSIDMLFS